MKKIRLLFCLLAVLFQGVSLSAKAQSFDIDVYTTAIGAATQMTFLVDVLTTDGVYHGEYYQSGSVFRVGNIPNHVWTGPSDLPAPIVDLITNASVVGDSNCPGMDDLQNSSWVCYRVPIKITVTGEVGGCPWLVSTKVHSVAKGVTETYTGPQTVQSTCPSVPLAPYDVSWDENYVVYAKTLRLQSTGGVIEQSLSTFLMKDGKLCDGSQLDDRGAYCRFVAQMITFTASGCDDAKVTVTPNPHPITDKELHDMVIRVDTSAMQPIDSTCRFQYVLNML